MQYTENQPESQVSEIIPTKKTLVSAFFVMLGKGSAMIASFVAITVLARFVPKETVGLYTTVMAFFTIISITTLPGTNGALARTIAQGKLINVGHIAKKRFLWGSIGIGISLVIGIMLLIIGNNVLGIGFLVMAPFVPLTDTLSHIAINFWQGSKKFNFAALIQVIYAVLYALVNILVFIVTDNLYLLIIGVLSGQAIAGYIVFKTIPKTFDSDSLDELMILGKKLTLMQSLKIISTHVDKIILAWIAGPLTVASYSFASIPLFKAQQLIPVGTVTLPHLSSQTHFSQKIKYHVLKKAGLLFLGLLPVVALAIILVPFVYKLLFPYYPESAHYLQLLLPVIILMPTGMIDAGFTAFHKTKQLFVVKITGFILRVSGMLIGGMIWGIYGIIGTLLITAFIESCLAVLLWLNITEDENRL